MDNKYPTLSDVERNKELFEYEMTQVILQLKGEFAKVSGKDLGLEDTDLSAPKMSLHSDIPDIKLNYSVNVSSDEPTKLQTYKNKSISLETQIKNSPKIPTVSAYLSKTVKMNSFQSDSPVIPSISPIIIDDVIIPKQNIDVKCDELSLTLPNEREITIETIDKCIFKEARISLPTAKKNVDINDIDISLPATAFNFSYYPRTINPAKNPIKHSPLGKCYSYNKGTIKVNEHNISVPDVGYKPFICNMNCKVDTVNCELPSTDIIPYVIGSEVDIKPIDISVPSNQFANISCDFSNELKIDVKQMSELPTVNIPNIKHYKAITTGSSEYNIQPPRTERIRPIIIDTVTIMNPERMKDFDTTQMDFNFSHLPKVEVSKTNINSDYKTITPFSISDVEVKPTNINFDVSSPDFDFLIESLLKEIV